MKLPVCTLVGCGRRVNALAATEDPPFCCSQHARLYYGAKPYFRGSEDKAGGALRALFDHEVCSMDQPVSRAYTPRELAEKTR